MKILSILLFLLLLPGVVTAQKSSFSSPPLIDVSEQKQFNRWLEFYEKSKSKNVPSRISKSDNITAPRYINSLIMSHSPYLLQHAHNPINWKPWSQQVLDKAKRENKLIFLSIGYSTCHWCHVMEEESFTKVEVARLVNKDFLAIKVDREELPAIDDYYAAALEQVKGSAGWPVTVIINGDGLPIFIDSYLPKEKLSQLLKKIHVLWGSQPEFLLGGARNIDAMVKQSFNLSVSMSEKVLTTEEMNLKLLSSLDPIYGGFRGEVKFPASPMLLYGLDQLRRKPHALLEMSLQKQLDAMISGGLYDHIQGGFHRYVMDAQWNVPHFEKMLYNQAQLMLVYAQAYEYFKDPAYYLVVKQTAEALMKTFYIEGQGFASALDADFNGKEGGYYLWDSHAFSDLVGIPSVASTYATEYPGKVGVILPLTADDGVQRIREVLTRNRLARGRPLRDNKVLTGWNALAIEAMLASSELLNEPDYATVAINLAQLLWENRYDKNSGHLFRIEQIKKHSRQGPRHLEDYAYYADALLALYDHTSNDVWLQRAHTVQLAAFQSFYQEDGSLVNSVGYGTSLSVTKSKDSELLSPASKFLGVLHKLDKRMATKQLAKRYAVLRPYVESKITADPLGHFYGALELNNVDYGSTTQRRYFANAKGNLTGTCREVKKRMCMEFALQITLQKGWHVNSKSPLQEYLKPTKVVLPEGFSVTYPKEKHTNLGFQEEPLSVYEGNFTIIITRATNEEVRTYFELPLQACSDKLCLLPEVFGFSM